MLCNYCSKSNSSCNSVWCHSIYTGQLKNRLPIHICEDRNKERQVGNCCSHAEYSCF